MPGTPKLTLEGARAIRAMALAGFTQVQLAGIFQVSKSLIGQIVLEQIWKDGGCEGCRGPLPPGRPSRLCDQCKPQFCQHCKGPKPVHRLSLNCVICDREKNKKGKETRPHVCRVCTEALPEGRRDTFCSECRRDEDQFYAARQAAQNRGKTCSITGCDNPIPATKWWRSRRCRPCQQRHEQLRRALSRRICGLCEKVLGDHERGLCRPCAAADRRIREITRREREKV